MIATRKSKFAAAAVAATVLAGGSTAAIAAATTSSPAGGTIHVFVNANVKSQTVDPILITGAVGDFGTATSTNKAGKVNPNGDYEQIRLKKGTFEVNAVAFDAKINKETPMINHTTCSILFTGSGPSTLFNGTGLYAGISGTVQLTVTFAGIAPRKASGACNFNMEPHGTYSSITGTGKVKF